MKTFVFFFERDNYGLGADYDDFEVFVNAESEADARALVKRPHGFELQVRQLDTTTPGVVMGHSMLEHHIYRGGEYQE